MVIASSDIYIRDQHVVNTLCARAIALQNELKRGAHGCITRQQITLIALPASSKRTSTSDSFHGSATTFLWLLQRGETKIALADMRGLNERGDGWQQLLRGGIG